MSQENVEMVRQALKSFNEGGADAAEVFYDPAVVLDNSQSPFPEAGLYRGLESVRKWFEGMAEAFGDFSYDSVARVRRRLYNLEGVVMPSDHPSHTVADPALNGHSLGHRLHRFLDSRVPSCEPPINPALLKREEERAEARQNRIADKITAFSGSMLFVYIHIIWFGCWIGFGVEDYPFGLLTMIVSLEAIFLSTFVMISQNRADARRQVIADQQWRTVQEEDTQNKELLDLSKQILALTKEVRSLAGAGGMTTGPGRRRSPLSEV